MINFTFANFNSYTDLHLITKNIQREAIALNPEEIEIPARMGSVYEGAKIGAKIITIDVLLMANNEQEKTERLRNFNSFVAQTISYDNEFELKLGDENDIVYWCHITNVSTPTRVVQRGADTEFSITFLCSEGVGVGEQQMEQITNPTHSFTNTGTADTFLNFNMIKVGGEPVNKIGVATDSQFIYVGVEDETNDVPPSKRVLNETMNTLASSTKIVTPSFVLENAIINPDTDIITTGKAMQIMSKDGRYFYGNAGSSVDTKKWRGAGRIWTLSQALENSWKVTARFYTQNNYARSKTKIELYLLNQAGIRIGRIMIKDGGISLQNDILVEVGTDSQNYDVFWSQRDANKLTKKEKDKSIKITTGTKTATAKTKSSSKKGDTVSVYQNVLENNSENLFTDFYGNITLLRYKENDIWTYKVAVQRLDNNGTEKGSPYVTYFRDTEKKYDVVMNQVASFALYSAHMPILEDKSTTTATYKNNQMQLTDLRAWQINDGAKDGEFLVETGDEIVIDGDNFSVTNNTVPVPHAIGSTFIKVKAGETINLGVFPEPDANHLWFVSWIPRYH